MRAAALAAAALGLAATARAASPVAGGVVMSREWRVHRGTDTVEEFSGDVRYHAGPTSVRCEEATYRHDADSWLLRRDVSVERTLDSGDRVAAKGQRAFLRMKDRSGWLLPGKGERLEMRRTPAEGGDPDLGRADRLDWAGEQASLTGEVHLWGPRVECWSDRADFDDRTGELHLSGGRPSLRKFPGWTETDDWAGAVKAEDVRAWQAQRILTADGAVTGWLEFSTPKKARSSK